MGTMQVIMRTERRRKWDESQRDAIMAACDVPGVTIRQVAQRYDVSESVIYSWRAERRKRLMIATEPQSFINYGTIADCGLSASAHQNPVADTAATPTQSPAILIIPTQAPTAPVLTQSAVPTGLDNYHVCPPPGDRPGTIELHLAMGKRVIVDSYVNERALLRALSALMDADARERQMSERRRQAVSNRDARADGRLETDAETRARARRILPDANFSIATNTGR